MKPLVSIIPEPDRSTEARKAIPRAWKEAALARTGGTCARLECEVTVGLEFDHMLALGLQGKHAAENIEPLCGPHHLAKTKRDMAMIARSKRLAGETCTGKPARPLQGRGFGNRTRKFDGTISPTRKALRQADSEKAGLSGCDGSREPEITLTAKALRYLSGGEGS